jgi:hypothetical protein
VKFASAVPFDPLTIEHVAVETVAAVEFVLHDMNTRCPVMSLLFVPSTNDNAKDLSLA